MIRRKYWAKNKIKLDYEDEWIREECNAIFLSRRTVYVCFPRIKKNFIVSRLIMRCPKGLVVDHINRDVFDNRRSNLRICTTAQNLRNRQSKNKVMGVRIDKRTKGKKRWVAYASTKEIRFKSLGCYETQAEASRARDAFVKQEHGEYALLNNMP